MNRPEPSTQQTARLVHGMLIEAAKKNSMGMVVTSHFSQVIEDMANRALLLVDGEIASSVPHRRSSARSPKTTTRWRNRTRELGEKILLPGT